VSITLNQSIKLKTGQVVVPILIEGHTVQCVDSRGKVSYRLYDEFVINEKAKEKTVITPNKVVFPKQKENIIKVKEIKEEIKEFIIKSFCRIKITLKTNNIVNKFTKQNILTESITIVPKENKIINKEQIIVKNNPYYSNEDYI